MATMNKIVMESSLMKSAPKTLSDRPLERIRFATPRAEMAYNRIRNMLTGNAAKLRRKSFGVFSSSSDSSDVPTKSNDDDDDDTTKTRNNKRKISFNDYVNFGLKKRKTTHEDPFIASLGPIPRENCNIFSKMCFVICEATEEEHVERNDPNEDELFFSEARLALQIKSGGGKVYASFEDVPTEEHKRTRLVTNAPSLHPQRILFLNAGMPAYSHRWIVRCCQKNKAVDPACYRIPAVKRIPENDSCDAPVEDQST